jgi:hypothetical protein
MSSICNILFNNILDTCKNTILNNYKNNHKSFMILDTCKNNILDNDKSFMILDTNNENYFDKLLKEIEKNDSIKQENSLKHTPLINEDFTSITSLIPDNKLIKMLIDGIMYFLIQILTIINLLLKYILQFITADSIDFISKNIKYV